MAKPKKFLFITALTPVGLLTGPRRELLNLCLQSLKQQSYKNWEAIILGEEEKKDGNIVYLKTTAKTKENKHIFANEYLNKLSEKPDYLIRLDDDDMISPLILERAATMNFDCYADQYHTFYNIVNGKIAQQKRPWLANTVIHKFEHAVTPVGEHKIPLFMHDHSQSWHLFYKHKRIVFTSRQNPIYLRIISPTSITSKSHSNQQNLSNYTSYLKCFGKWRYYNLKEYRDIIMNLEFIKDRFYSEENKISPLNRLFGFLKHNAYKRGF